MDVHWRSRASAMLAIVHAKPEAVIFFLIQTNPEQECKIKPNLFSVSVEVEQEQARKDKSIAVTGDLFDQT